MSAVRAALLGHGAGPITPAHVAQLEHLVSTGDAAASHLLPTAGNKFHLVDDAGRFADELVQDIAGAEHHINLTEYAIHPGSINGPVSHKVLDALGTRASEGLPVNVQVEQLGTGLWPRRKAPRAEMIEAMRDSGITIIERPFRLLTRGPLDDARFAVDHRKIFDIDGRVAWQGGINLVDAWAPWYDLMQRVEGPAAAQLGAVNAARWRDLGGMVTPQRLEVLKQGLMTPVDDAWEAATRVLTDGNRHRRELSEAFVEVANGAQQRLWLMDPYLSDPRAMNAVVGAAERLGPDARLYLSPKVAGGGQGQDLFTDPLRRAWAYSFADAGGEVILLPEFSHAKAWIADDIAGVGSHNKDRSSIRRSYENLVATDDATAVAQLEATMESQRGVGQLAGDDAIAGWRNLARVRDALHLQY